MYETTSEFGSNTGTSEGTAGGISTASQQKYAEVAMLLYESNIEMAKDILAKWDKYSIGHQQGPEIHAYLLNFLCTNFPLVLLHMDKVDDFKNQREFNSVDLEKYQLESDGAVQARGFLSDNYDKLNYHDFFAILNKRLRNYLDKMHREEEEEERRQAMEEKKKAAAQQGNQPPKQGIFSRGIFKR